MKFETSVKAELSLGESSNHEISLHDIDVQIYLVGKGGRSISLTRSTSRRMEPRVHTIFVWCGILIFLRSGKACSEVSGLPR